SRRPAGDPEGGRLARPPVALGGDAQRRPRGDGRATGGRRDGGRGLRGPRPAPPDRPAGPNRRRGPAGRRPGRRPLPPRSAPGLRRGRAGPRRGRVLAAGDNRGLPAALGRRARPGMGRVSRIRFVPIEGSELMRLAEPGWLILLSLIPLPFVWARAR